MSNSLFDQLKKSGLVDEKKAKKASQEKRTQSKKQNKRKKNDPAIDENKQRIQQAAQEKAQRDRELNKQRDEEAHHKAVLAQIKQLIETNVVDTQQGEVAFNFVDQGKVQKIYVTEAIQNQLSNGRLAIVKLDERYKIVAKPMAEKISQRDASFVVVCNDNTASEDDEDDPYADYKIPDDLMW